MITILGLGPGDAALITREAWEVLSNARTIHLRTRQHPAVAGLPPHLKLLDFDAHYDSGASFDQVYRRIVKALLRAAKTRDHFIKLLATEIPEAVINGSLERRLPNNVNISLPHLSDPELAVLFLDKEGIACSTKSSCLKGEEDSYVVKTLGGESWRSKNTLRFTFAPNATLSDVSYIVRVLKKLSKSSELSTSA